MQLIYDKGFLKGVKILPKNIQSKLAHLLELLQENPFAPLLHAKRLSGELAGFFSFRITREWRVIFYFRDPEIIQLLKVAHRRDIYR